MASPPDPAGVSPHTSSVGPKISLRSDLRTKGSISVRSQPDSDKNLDRSALA